MDFVTELKLHIYGRIASSARVPPIADMVRDLAVSRRRIVDALTELERQRLVVLDASTREILMAPPFSAVETPHGAEVEGRVYAANCVWDAFGVVAALGGTGVARTRSGGTGEALLFPVQGSVPEAATAVFHYAVPAARWWDDIVFT